MDYPRAPNLVVTMYPRLVHHVMALCHLVLSGPIIVARPAIVDSVLRRLLRSSSPSTHRRSTPRAPTSSRAAHHRASPSGTSTSRNGAGPAPGRLHRHIGPCQRAARVLPSSQDPRPRAAATKPVSVHPRPFPTPAVADIRRGPTPWPPTTGAFCFCKPMRCVPPQRPFYRREPKLYHPMERPRRCRLEAVTLRRMARLLVRAPIWTHRAPSNQI